MTNTYSDTAKQLILNDITDVDISSVTFNADELYLAPDNAVYSVNNATPVNGNVTLDAANKDLSNLSTTGNAKFQAQITGGASTITSSNLTANKAVISNASGKVAVSSVTSSELGYLLGVTSNVQTQLNGKQATLESGTNIKTINSTSLLGSGNISVGTVTSVNNVSPVNGNVTITIPSEVTETTVTNWGFTKNTGTVTSVNNVSPVNGNVTLSIPTQPSDISALDTNASNLSSTGQKVFDGQWVISAADLIPNGNATISDANPRDISQYLPNDNYKYEVILTGTGMTGTTAGNQQQIRVRTDLMTDDIYLWYMITRTNSVALAANTVILTVGTGRTIQVKGYEYNTGTYSLYLRGYRRIGTNS